MNKSILVTNIQRFSLHDGPGIRTTVFLKGCSIKCPWCSNPENQNLNPEPYVKDGLNGVYGNYMDCDDIYEEIIKDKLFYDFFEDEEAEQVCGGVTFSGGEPLLQIDKLQPLLEKLNKEHVHVAVETCLFIQKKMLDIAIQHINLFYVDVKILDEKICKSALCGDLNLYLSNLERLFESGVPVIIRIPVIGGWTDSVDNRNRIIELLRKFRPLKVELIKEHNLATSKYQSLSRPIPEFRGVTDEDIGNYCNEILGLGIPTEICKI